MKMLQNIEIEALSLDLAMAEMPFYADTCYSVSVELREDLFGAFLPILVLTRSVNPKGWETLAQTHKACLCECQALNA